MLETSTILRAVLYHIKTAKNLRAAEHAVQAMCSKDDIAAVNMEIEEMKKEEDESKVNG